MKSTWKKSNYNFLQKISGLNRFALLFTGVILFMAIAAPLICNKKPLYVNYKGRHLFPTLTNQLNYVISETEALSVEFTDWKSLPCEAKIFTVIPWSPGQMDYLNAGFAAPGGKNYYKDSTGKISEMPFFFRHHLGTDKLGRDVLSGLIHGSCFSLVAGLFSMLLAMLIGIFSGACAGYFGNDGVNIYRGQTWMLCMGMPLLFFYVFVADYPLTGDHQVLTTSETIIQIAFRSGMGILLIMMLLMVGKKMAVFRFFRKKKSVPVDSFIQGMAAVMNSIPRLMLILSLSAFLQPSLFTLVLIIGMTSWHEVMRLTRAEFIKLRSMDYILSARALGFSHWRILFRHALPNALSPALTLFAFGVSSAMLTESSLSFLGIGIPQDVVTWGSMLAQARENFSAWWMVLFPGLLLFLTLLSLNVLGENLRDKMDVKTFV